VLTRRNYFAVCQSTPCAPAVIDDHINYLMIRYDPDKVTPLRSEAQSNDYLSKPAPR